MRICRRFDAKLASSRAQPTRGWVQALMFGVKLTAVAVERVAQRVRQGGHDIPEATIRRRFDAGKRLLVEVYRPLVDQWVLYDNAGDKP